MVTALVIACIFQVVGSIFLALFSFRGVKVETAATVYIENKPAVTNVSVEPKYLGYGKWGLVLLIIGLLIATVVSIVAAVPSATAA
jgi:hypothetical protein